MNTRTKEAVRYLGYGIHAIDEPTLKLIQEAFEELDQIVNAKFVYRIFEISETKTNELKIGELKVQS